jgi:hypothetical protein
MPANFEECRAHALTPFPKSNPPNADPERKERGIDTPLQALLFLPAHFSPTSGPSDLRWPCATAHCPIRCEQCVIARRWILRGLRRGPNAGHGVGNATCNMRTEWAYWWY